MAARKRASTQSKLLNRAVKAGRSALRQAQRRLPPDVRKQIEKTVKEGQKTVYTAIKQVESRLDRTARQGGQRAPRPAAQRRARQRRGKPQRARQLLAGARRDDRPGREARLPPSRRRRRATGSNPATRPLAVVRGHGLRPRPRRRGGSDPRPSLVR